MATTCLSYHPTELDAARFWEKQHGKTATEADVPTGYPRELHSPLAWTRAEVEKKKSEWVLELSKEDVEAIDAALAMFEAHSGDLSNISVETFSLPSSLSQSLKQVSTQCYTGIGFKIVRGIDPSRYTLEQNAAVYAGIAAHVAPQRGFVDRSYEGVLSHIVNVAGENPEAESKAPGFTSTHLSFHSDNCEIMGLYCLDTALEGGRTLVSSSWQLYNELAAKRPDVLKTLAEIWVLDTFKDYRKSPPLSVPFLDRVDGESVLLRFSRYPITGWQRKRNPALPAPTQAQLEAIDAVQFTAAANSVPLPMGKGDIVFVNDMAILHAREAFSEGGVYMKRHLLKMFFRDPVQNWQVPVSAEAGWKKMYGPNRADGSRHEIWCTKYEAGMEEEATTNG